MFVNKSFELVQYLQRFGFLTAADMEMIQSKIEIKPTRRNQNLLKIGETSNEIYFVLEGLVKSSIINNDREITTWVAIPGKFIVEFNSFTNRVPSILNLQAIQRSYVAVFTREALIELNSAIPQWKDLIIKIIAEYYVELERLYFFCLGDSARERYEKMCIAFPDHFKKVPLKHLADILHIKPETLSRIRK